MVNVFFWCERRLVFVLNLIICCVCLRDVIVFERLGNNIVVFVGFLVVILYGCFVMFLYVIGRSICFFFDFFEELRSFIFFWIFV